MFWRRKSRPPSPATTVAPACHIGASTADEAVHHYLSAMSDDTSRIVLQPLSAWRTDELFVYGGPLVAPSGLTTLLLGYALVRRQPRGWSIRQTNWTSYASPDSLMVTTKAFLSGTLLIYGYIQTPHATVVEIICAPRQRMRIPLITPVFGILAPRAKDIRDIVLF